MSARLAIGENFVVVFYAVFIIVVLERRLDGFIGMYRAMKFVDGQTVKGFDYGFVGKRKCLGHGFALDQLGCHGT